MHQYGRCGYCGAVMTDSAQVDHMDENCGNDKSENLIACCCNCHGDKTQHYRKKRTCDLRRMLERGMRNKERWDAEWADEDDDHYARLPPWLQDRVSPFMARMHSLARRPEATAQPFENYRYHAST